MRATNVINLHWFRSRGTNMVKRNLYVARRGYLQGRQQPYKYIYNVINLSLFIYQ